MLTLKKIKHLSSKLPDGKIFVYDGQNHLVGWLCIVGSDDLSGDDIPEKITSWRNRFKKSFLSQTTTTVERTRKWLQNILESENRLMFIVEDSSEAPVGTYGAIFHADHIELDNAMCGEKTAVPAFMHHVERCFVNWLFETFNPEFINANIISNNITAILLHKEIGFKVFARRSLRKVERPKGELVLEVDSHLQNPELYYIEMRISRENFVAARPVPEPVKFDIEKRSNIKKLSNDTKLQVLANEFIVESARYKYSYNFSWMGRPIIQYPQDIVAMQEILWEVQPDLLIETGIAHGGSLIFYASILELIGKGEVIGIDIDIREHNRKEIEAHPMFKRISMIEGSSVSEGIIEQVSRAIKNKETVMVVLDSNHTHEHVLKELEMYYRFVTKGSYLVVFDTIIEDMPDKFFPNRPWGKGNNPKTAVREFLKNHDEFVIDKDIEHKLLITVAPDGYLKKVR